MKITKIAAALAVGASVADAQFGGFNFANIASKFNIPASFPKLPGFPAFGGPPPFIPPAAPTTSAAAAVKTTSTSTSSVKPASTTTSSVKQSSSSSTTSASSVSPIYTYKPSSYGSFTTAIVPTLSSSTGSVSTLASSASASVAPQATNDATHRGNWLPGYNITTDYSTSWPNTGVTVKYDFTLTNQTMTIAGVTKQVLVINNQYPGPLIEANWGDYIQITVNNKLANNGTSMHWHGMRQLNSNLQDGVGGITECPLAPGDSRTYLFQATQYGTSWYHSHFSVQFGDGILGPVVVHGPASANYDIDLGTILVQDLYPQTVFQEDYYAHRNGPPSAINYILNGQNSNLAGTAGTQPRWTFTPGKKHLLRFVNTAVDALWKIQIDGHKLLVIQADFVPITPYYTNELSIAIGQRYMVIVEANQPASNYWLRAMAATDCTFSANDGTGSVANGIVTYSNATSLTALPTTTYGNHSTACVDEPMSSLVPIVSQAVDSTQFQSVVSNFGVNIAVVKQNDGSQVFQWTLGGISEVVDWGNPTIGEAALGNTTFTTAEHVVQLTKANTWTYWVIQNQFFVPHPMHLHGHDFNLLGQGTGTFNPSTDASKLNFAAPPRRDVAMLVASGWTVIAFQTDNPGAWLMHCHIAWHAGEGLSLQFLERPADIPALYGTGVTSTSFTNTCPNWNAYEPTAVWQQYDSGLKKREEQSPANSLYSRRTLEGANLGRRHSHAEGHVRRHVRQFK